MSDFNPVFPPDRGPIGIYIHIPFCRGKCNYCAFVTNPHDPALEKGYVKALINEMELRRQTLGQGEWIGHATVDSIYFGGGTPSLFHPNRLAELIDACRSTFAIVEGAELSVELNPATADRATLGGFREAGIDDPAVGPGRS